MSSTRLFFLMATLSFCGQAFGADLAAQANAIQVEIEAIRGAKFKHSIAVAHQSQEDFIAYLNKMADQEIPPSLSEHYGKVVTKLGLYRGPEIKDFRALVTTVMQTQAAAYYDPAANTFYVVMEDIPKPMMDSIYAHELYHGFQDQHYNLDDYLLSQVQKLDDDRLLARQAVVEGEATYIMSLWTLQNQLGTAPTPAMLDMVVKMQTQLDVQTLKLMLKSSAIPMGKSMESAIQAMDKIPPFMIEKMIGAYLKGVGFVAEIQKQGWDKVDELYRNPPVSSEQILHPEKWFAKENPFTLQWPSFDDKLFSEWTLLEANTIGEFQWRIIFSEYGLGQVGVAAAAGWDGDSFAVFEHKKTKQLLLLAYTSWDSKEEAQQFSAAYQTLLKSKYPEENEAIKILEKEKDVLIIEGGQKQGLEDLMEFMQRTHKTKI